MEFCITIDFCVDSDVVLDKKVCYEYFLDGKRQELYSDKVIFEENKITIEGIRSSPIDFENCWKSKRSNYKRCILSSLFYLYNFHKKPIEIQAIKIFNPIAPESEVEIPFVQEFNEPLKNEFTVDLDMIEYLFKSIRYKEISDLIYRVLHSQAQFSNNNDFYSAYRSFNALYTFIYTYHNNFITSTGNKFKDTEAITDILKIKNIELKLKHSIPLAEDFVVNNSDEMYKLLYVWMLNNGINKGNFKDKIMYSQFSYENKDVLEILKRLLENYFDAKPNEYTQYLNKFNRQYNKNSTDSKINFLQLIVVYGLYRRNKLFHGEHVESTFLIPDINAEILERISQVIFQLSIDLVNYIDEPNFRASNIFLSNINDYDCFAEE